jgi:hypothetical protein
MAHSTLYVRVYDSFRETRIFLNRKRGAVHSHMSTNTVTMAISLSSLQVIPDYVT